MNPGIRKFLSLILAAVCVISIARVLTQWTRQGAGDDAYENAAAIAQSAASPIQVPASTEAASPEITELAAAPTAPPEPVWVPAPVEEEDIHLTELASIDLAALRQVNPDVVGWICIPNSKINYPLMQGEDNTFYLEHTWEGVKNPYGSIYVESRNSPDLTDFNTIVYGHNMLNGSMFAGLSNYAYQWYWTWNPYVYIVTDAGVFRYEIFSSYAAQVDSATYGLSFHQLQTRQDIIAHALENSQIDTGITPAVTDRILTLSTCTGMGYESRRVVHAVLKMIPAE